MVDIVCSSEPSQTCIVSHSVAVNFNVNAIAVRGKVGIVSSGLITQGTASYLFTDNPSCEDTMGSCSVLSTLFETDNQLIDSVAFSEAIVTAWSVLAQSTCDLSASTYLETVATVVDNLIMSGTVANVHEAYTLISDAITLLDALSVAWGQNIISDLGMDVDTYGLVQFIPFAVSALDCSAEAGNIFTFIGVADDTLEFDIESSVVAYLTGEVTDGIVIGGGLTYGDVSYVFSMNTLNEAVSTYTNYNFNSISGNFAATSTGIYQLSGDDDAGTSIDAVLRTALSDFEETKLKQIHAAYIGYSSTGHLMFKTISDQNGQRSSRWYKLKQTKAAEDVGRLKLGKGVKSRYWQFELTNVDGSDFSIESIEFVPIILKRRVY